MTKPTLIYRSILPMFIGIYAILSLYVMSFFIRGFAKFSFAPAFYGPSAEKPMVFRVFIPTISETLRSMVPDATQQSIAPTLIEILNNPIIHSILQVDFVNVRFFQFCMVVFVVYLALLAFIFMLYTLTKTLLPDSRAYSLLSPIIGILMVPIFNHEWANPCDFAEAFFTCTCFYLLFKQHWKTYLLCLAIATTNKESTIFIVFFYSVWFFSRLEIKAYIALGLLQLNIYALVKGGIMFYYTNNPGGIAPLLQNTLENLGAFVNDYDYGSFIDCLGTVLLVAAYWGEKPAFLRGGLWIAVANFMAFPIIGHHGELRVFYVSLPILVILATHTIVRLTDIAQLPIFQAIPKDKVLSGSGSESGGHIGVT